VIIFLAGAAVGLSLDLLLSLGDKSERTPHGWREEMADFLNLYTRDSLANLPEDRSLHETELKSVGRKVGLDLSVEKVALDRLVLKRSQLLNFDGRPLAQIAYLAPSGVPVAFFIFANGEGDHELGFEERHGENIFYRAIKSRARLVSSARDELPFYALSYSPMALRSFVDSTARA
jgi:hypothetical protein